MIPSLYNSLIRSDSQVEGLNTDLIAWKLESSNHFKHHFHNHFKHHFQWPN